MSLYVQGHLRQLTFLMGDADAAQQHCSHHPPRCGEVAPRPRHFPRTNNALKVRAWWWNLSHYTNVWSWNMSFPRTVPLTDVTKKTLTCHRGVEGGSHVFLLSVFTFRNAPICFRTECTAVLEWPGGFAGESQRWVIFELWQNCKLEINNWETL